MRAPFDPDRLVEVLRDRLEGDRRLAQRIVERMLQLERQRDEGRRMQHEANRMLHRLDLDSGPYSGLSVRRKLAALEALLRPRPD